MAFERLEALISGTTAPILDVKTAHLHSRTKMQPRVTAQFPPEDVNSYDELVSQLAEVYPDKMKHYTEILFDRVQTPDDIPRALGTLAIILEQETS